MEWISTTEAGVRAKRTRQAIVLAIKRGEITARRVGHIWAVCCDKKFKSWVDERA